MYNMISLVLMNLAVNGIHNFSESVLIYDMYVVGNITNFISRNAIKRVKKDYCIASAVLISTSVGFYLIFCVIFDLKITTPFLSIHKDNPM